jgi:hypothetical protein
LLIAVRGRRLEPLRAFAIASVGALLLILWIEHRPRAGESPYPLLPMMAVAAAVLLGSLARHRPSVARWTSVGLAGLVVVTLATSWVAPAARAWTGWPAYDRLLGWEGGRFEGLYDERVWAEVASSVQARAAPGEGIFVALTNNSSRHHANAPIFYWYTDRPPASRFIEFNPCLTDTDPVQREIVADLADVDVVVATTFFPDTRTRGSTVLDAYLRANFQPVYRGELPKEQAVVVLERTS